ncbi:hypothetical protein EMMF5_003837 [Cystobasidiomycetes sp. EMM_F5]
MAASPSLVSFSPSRKRKLAPNGRRSSPSPSSSPSSSSSGAGHTGNRPLAGSKRTRLAAQHPLARPSLIVTQPSASVPLLSASSSAMPSPSFATSSPAIVTPKPTYHHHLAAFKRAPLYRLVPSPPAISLNGTPQVLDDPLQLGGTSLEHRTCVTCKRTATSTIALAKFKRCQLCAGSFANGSSHSAVIKRGKSSDGFISNVDRQEAELVDSFVPSPRHCCGKVVCRECSIESPAGVPTCHACLSANLPRPAAILDPAHADSPGDMDSIDTSNGVPISIADYDFSDLPMDDD